MTGGDPLRVYMMEVGPLAVNAYLVEHVATRKAVVIDPGGDGEMIAHGSIEMSDGCRVR